MDSETALEHRTRTGVNSAYYELEKHQFDGMVMSDVLYAAPKGTTQWERVCIVYKGEIKTRPLMLWLGY